MNVDYLKHRWFERKNQLNSEEIDFLFHKIGILEAENRYLITFIVEACAFDWHEDARID